ncbi:hypothetical protein MNB_SV-13-2118 [hydrothermal vent metagenome]|uniref:DUF4395 domain-containing protein n=1 Tax=hydrothermal vent metagenome TaxID=652676 RepID=A0A1W1D0N7_9ZZZZ
MPQACPISFYRIDTNSVRLIALQVTLLSLAFLLTHEIIFALILLFDFSIRTLRLAQFSPLHKISTFILQTFKVTAKLSDEAPKRFALYLGFMASFLLLFSSLGGFILFSTSITIILLVCALLETLFDYCIGCKIYYAIQLLKGLFNHGRNI